MRRWAVWPEDREVGGQFWTVSVSTTITFLYERKWDIKLVTVSTENFFYKIYDKKRWDNFYVHSYSISCIDRCDFRKILSLQYIYSQAHRGTVHSYNYQQQRSGNSNSGAPSEVVCAEWKEQVSISGSKLKMIASCQCCASKRTSYIIILQNGIS
jgi:hypothetical protein